LKCIIGNYTVVDYSREKRPLACFRRYLVTLPYPTLLPLRWW